MVDNIDYFDIVCNSKWFRRLSIILFFNNNKEFEQVFERNKIVKININRYDDVGDDELNQERYTFDSSSDGLNFIQEKYIQIATKSSTSRQVYTHVSNEESDNLQTMLRDVQSIVIRINMIKGGLIVTE